MRRLALLVSVFLIPILPLLAHAYPNGTPHYATDTGPFCASCHSSMRPEYMPELPDELARKETPEAKHFGLVRAPMPSPYAELTEAQKQAVIEEARFVDSKSTVTLDVPLRVKAGSELSAVVKARGGNGPVICVMLVDRALRFQSRPPSADGWMILSEPAVKGADKAVLKTSIANRRADLPKNLNFVTIEGLLYDRAKEVLPQAEVTYKLKAPARPGAYKLTAAFLYGTENATGAAFFQRPSGRILFSEEVVVTVE